MSKGQFSSYKGLKSGLIVDGTFVEVPKQRNSTEENEQIKQGEVPERTLRGAFSGTILSCGVGVRKCQSAGRMCQKRQGTSKKNTKNDF